MGQTTFSVGYLTGNTFSPTLRCVLQLRISCPQWAVFNGVKGQTSVIVQSDPSISIKGSLLLGERILQMPTGKL